MNSFTSKKVFWLSIVLVLCFASTAFETAAQSKKKPLFQTITIKPGDKSKPKVGPTPPRRVKKTGKSVPKKLSRRPIKRASAFSTTMPALANVAIPGYSGVLVETLDGRVILQNYSNAAFNPASNVKIATAYAVLKTFGPNYRFKTIVWTDGFIDRSRGTLNGNLYVSGRDPIFNYQHAVSIANSLNRLGITKINGDLIVTTNFAMNYSRSAVSSGNRLFATLNGAKRSSAAKRAWNNYVVHSGNYGKVRAIPSVFFTGRMYVQSIPSNAKSLFTHESTPMREIVKATLIFSNNFLAKRLGDMLGGAYAVARTVQYNARVSPYEFSLASSSGLGINRVTPRAQMRLLRTFRAELKKHNMSFTDVMPVAGIDKGTLARRFTTGFSRGSLVGKTGTLGRTDGGVSTLSGEIRTRRGTLLFVIFNQRGNVRRFRSFQNSYVSRIQGAYGGALPIPYTPIPIERRLAKSRIKYPRGSRFRIEE